MKKFLLCLVGLVMTVGQLAAEEQKYTLKSPDGKLVTHIVATEKEEITYDIVYNGVTIVMPSHAGLNRAYGKRVTGSTAVTKASTATVDETVASPFTRQATMRNHYNESTLKMKDGLTMVFRAYNEGVAYRYQATMKRQCHT